VEREWRNVTPFSLSGVLLCRLSLKLNADYFGRNIRRLPEDGHINTATLRSQPLSKKQQRRGSNVPKKKTERVESVDEKADTPHPEDEEELDDIEDVEDVPEPPEGWHEENKSDVPDDELEGLDD